MENGFYRLPMLLSSVFEDETKNLAMCSEPESIDQHIDLILTTCPGEHKFDKSFGCGIWDMDFVSVNDRIKWEIDFKTQIVEAIRKFETRLKDVNIVLDVQDVSLEDKQLQSTAIKKKVTASIHGKLISNDEFFSSYYVLYLGPLSTKK